MPGHLDIIDLTNLAAPTLVREVCGVPSPDAFDGRQGYEVVIGGLCVLDLGDPDRPRLAGSAAIGEPFIDVAARAGSRSRIV